MNDISVSSWRTKRNKKEIKNQAKAEMEKKRKKLPKKTDYTIRGKNGRKNIKRSISRDSTKNKQIQIFRNDNE